MNGFRSFRALAVNEVRASVRNRTALIFTLGLAVLFMIIFGLLFGGSGFSVTFDAVNNDNTAASSGYIKALRAVSGVTVDVKSHVSAFADLKDDSVTAVLVIPGGFGAAYEGQGPPQQVAIYQAGGGSSSTAIADAVVSSVTAGFAGRGHPSLTVSAPKVAEVNQVTEMDYMLPSMIAYIILFSGVNYVAIGLVEKRVTQVLRRFRATPVRSSTILAAQVVGGGLTVLLQILVLVALGVWVFGAKNYGSWLLLIPPIVLGTASFVGIGFLITSVSRTSEAARALAAMITFPLMFLSGLFFPISSLPTVVQDIARVLPLAWASDALHQVMNDGAGFSAIGTDCLVMAAWAVVTISVAAWRFRWD
jgi:ABC-2 type transport system permease protein